MSGLVLALCNRTRNMVGPWLDAGFDAVTVDLQDADVQEDRRRHAAADVTDLPAWIAALRPAIIFAFPPCTDLAVSGARHFRDKGLPKLIKALQVVNACRELCEASGAPYMIENPVSTLATYWREPDHAFDPADFALYAEDPESQAYTKKTCLWTGGGLHHAPALASKGVAGQQDVEAAALGQSRRPSRRDAGGIRPRRLRSQPPVPEAGGRLTAP